MNKSRYRRQQHKKFSGPDGDFHWIDWGGFGPLLHLSHATGFCAGVYTPLAERLLVDFRIIGMDDRGHGATSAAADPTKLLNWNIFAEDLELFVENLSEPVIAVGHSRGAISSLKLAINRPEMVKALVLIDPIILPSRWNWFLYLAKKTGLIKLIPIVHGAAIRRRMWDNRMSMLSAYRKKTPFKNWQPGFLENYVVYGTKDTDEGFIELACDPAWESRCFAVCPHDTWRLVSLLRHPTLVIYGSESDVFLTSTGTRLKAMLPFVETCRFQNTSHFVPMERPDECGEAILRFIRSRGIV